MSIAETIKAECKRQNIPVSRLEKELGFCNGYVRGLKDKIPLDRAKEVSEYLNIPLSLLIEGESEEESYYLDPETQALAEQLKANHELKALFDVARDMPKEKLEAIYNLLKNM